MNHNEKIFIFLKQKIFLNCKEELFLIYETKNISQIILFYNLVNKNFFIFLAFFFLVNF